MSGERRTPDLSEQQVNRLLRGYLREEWHEDANRVASMVLDELDTTPQRRSAGMAWRFLTMNSNIVRVGLVAAAVVVIAIIAINLLPGTPPPGSGPTPSPSVAPTEAAPSVQAGIPEGPFLLADPEDLTPRITVTIPGPGWQGDVGGAILLKGYGDQDGAGMIVFAQEEFLVFGDPCKWASTIPDTPVTTVDEFVAALSAQASRDASEPVDVTVGGYTGKSITLHVPDDADFDQCDEGTFGTWDCGNPGVPSPCGFVALPGETSTEYILDVDGVIVAWHTGYGPEASADVIAELEAIVQSAAFGE